MAPTVEACQNVLPQNAEVQTAISSLEAPCGPSPQGKDSLWAGIDLFLLLHPRRQMAAPSVTNSLRLYTPKGPYSFEICYATVNASK